MVIIMANNEIDIEIEELPYTSELLQKFEARAEQFKKARKLLNHLDIKYGFSESDSISIVSLYDLLTDEDRLNEIVKKLKMKAFW